LWTVLVVFWQEEQMQFSDIHIHAVCGVDDGAKNKEDMFAIIDAAYADGTRLMCVTPHFNPGMFGEHSRRTRENYEVLRAYVAEKYPDMQLMLGNELRYASGCKNWIYDGVCNTIGGTKYVLLEFSFTESSDRIIRGVESMFNGGFIPIIAHVERYSKLSVAQIRELREKGVLMQIDSMSLLRDFGFKEWMRSKKLLAERIADFVSSDAHDTGSRPPELSPCYEYVKKKFGERYANAIFFENAYELFGSQKEREV
jgi:protein-tyrosine phosphatase